MEIDKSILKQIIDEYKGNDLAGYITKEINEINKIRTTRTNIQFELNKEINDHESKVKRIKEKLTKIQKECKHLKTYYEPDPAGGRDSTTQCVICGKYL